MLHGSICAPSSDSEQNEPVGSDRLALYRFRELQGKIRRMTNMHFTMREIFQPKRLFVQAVLCMMTVALFVHMGPFGTYLDMPVSTRIAYWGVIMVVNWSICSTALQAAAIWAYVKEKSPWLVVTAAALAASLPATGTVYVANVLFRPEIVKFASLLTLFPSVAVVTMAIGLITIQLTGMSSLKPATEPEPAPDKPPGPPSILRRLPLELRGELVRLSMNDHYVEVETVKGSTLVLLRFADALQELGEADGLQVHRSHWVARSAVENARRDGARWLLTLTTGAEVPVSRTFRSAAKAAGLF